MVRDFTRTALSSIAIVAKLWATSASESISSIVDLQPSDMRVNFTYGC